MRRLCAILILGTVGCNPPAQRPAVSTAPRHPMAVTCYIGQLDSGRNCSSQVTCSDVGWANFTPSLRCGDSGGKISKVEWHFLCQRDGKDIYRVIRRFPADDPAPAVTTKEVEFSGERVVVFQDEVHCIAVETPKK